MNNKLMIIAVLVLVGVALAQSGAQQTMPAPQASGNVATVDTNSPAYRNGYEEGYRQGANDSAANANYGDTSSPAYNLGTAGYQPQYGDMENYQKLFRRGYIEGYKAGWHFNAGVYCPNCSAS